MTVQYRKDGNHLERLVLRKGRFILEEASTPKLRLALSKNAFWKNIGNDCYETSDLGAAKHYRRFADEKVEKVFKEIFQELYGNTPIPPHLDQLLDPHQREGLRWILSRKRSYLAHAPGAGKTAQAILAACLCKGTGQSLFIVPPSLVINWEREILKFTEWLGIFPTIGMVRTSDRKEDVAWRADFLLCPDSMLTKDWVYEKLSLLRTKFIAVDEASRFKERNSERTVSLFGGRNGGRLYRGLFRKARHIVLLDGSPMPNRPIELWAPTFALHPEAIDCKSYDDFGYRYCGAKPNDRGVWEYLYSSNEAELKSKLQKDFMHVVTEDKLTHPERLRSMVFLQEDLRSPEHKEWERKNLTPEYLREEMMGQGDIAYFRKQLGMRKAPYIAAYVAERLREKNESILLFAWHREVCEALLHDLDPWGTIVYGGVKASAREKAFTEFQRGTKKLLILNIAAGGRGHNLPKADRVIFGEFSWTDELNRQCEKRASRKGSTKAYVRCEYLVSPNSMDELVLRSVFTKEKRVKRVIG